LARSEAISADVTAAVDPGWESAHEMQNAALIGHGVAIKKYTGHGGKYDSSEASAEYVAKIRRILKEAGVIWQADELGKIDHGGGETVAMYLARRGMDVIDIGPPVVSMHSPFEVVSKADIYMAYKAYKAFFESE
jgi:aspartyl aminopeptidase